MISWYGPCTEVKVGCGALNDAAMRWDMCHGDGFESTLVDDGYPADRIEFKLPDNSEEHSAARAVCERYFGRLKVTWSMVGHVWGKKKKDWFDLTIRAAFILTNMNVFESNGLNAH